MGKSLKSVAVLVAVIGVAYLVRTQLVHLLTRTTGTWVGTPDG